MLAVQGIYDGKTIRPLEPIRAHPNVKVIITFLEEEPVAKPAAEEAPSRYPLRGSVLRYDEPLEPVAASDWEALK